jgi:poly(3-hydroxybutyrate) depolymerase
MLYQIREAQRSILNPVSGWADAMSKLFSNPYSPFSYGPMATRVAAGFELMYRLGKEYEKPAFGIKSVLIEGTEVPIVEKVEISKPFCRLIRFERLLPSRLDHRAGDPTVLIFAPLSGHHSTLLRDTVRTMMPAHNVLITDWLDARMVPMRHGEFHLHDYVAYAIEFIRHLGPMVHLISVCQPTVPVMAAASIMASLKDPRQAASLTMMGGPIDPRQSPTRVNDLAVKKPFGWFERTVIHRVPGKYPGAGRRVYPGFLQHAGFVSMNPDRHAQSHWDFYLNLVRGDEEDADSHREFYDEYNAVLDLPADYYLETIRFVFQEHLLPRGKWVVPFEGKDIRVKPQDITDVPLLSIEGELDDISGVGQTRAAHALCTGIAPDLHRHFEAPGTGHYGIFSGRRWREHIYPVVREFIAGAEKRSIRKN